MDQRKDRRATVLRELEQSGLSMAEFCRRRDLPYATVALWRSSARREPVRFVEVEAAQVRAESRTHGSAVLCAEVLLPGGAVLRVYQSTGTGGAS